jgi:hypothetical protein
VVDTKVVIGLFSRQRLPGLQMHASETAPCPRRSGAATPTRTESTAGAERVRKLTLQGAGASFWAGATARGTRAATKALVPQVLSVPPKQILFISSNWWDAAGAKSFGYKVCWCNRSQGHMQHLGFSADVTISRLDQIPDCL